MAMLAARGRQAMIEGHPGNVEGSARRGCRDSRRHLISDTRREGSGHDAQLDDGRRILTRVAKCGAATELLQRQCRHRHRVAELLRRLEDDAQILLHRRHSGLAHRLEVGVHHRRNPLLEHPGVTHAVLQRFVNLRG